MKHRLALVLAGMLVLPLAGQAQTAGELRALIIAGGKNENEQQRNSVRINGCTMTTERWWNDPDHGWVLYSSFRFNMWSAPFEIISQDPSQMYIYVGVKDGPNAEGTALVFFEMRGDAMARFEKSVLRKPKRKTRPSPRGDGTSHYYVDIDRFFFSMRGPGVEAKAAQFTQSYVQYVDEHCTPIS